MKILDWKEDINKDELDLVNKCLSNGKLVIFPTETVYGIGADARNSKSVDDIFIAKGRANDNPLIVHLGNKEDISKYAIIQNEVEYRLVDGTLTVVGYQGNASVLVIPNKVEGYTVTKIGESAFEGNTVLTSIDLPDSITVIGKKAFKNCVNLSEMK